MPLEVLAISNLCAIPASRSQSMCHGSWALLTTVLAYQLYLTLSDKGVA